MNQPLYVQPDGVRTCAQVHGEVVDRLREMTGAAATELSGVQTTHGPIAAAVSDALAAVLESRQHTLQATANTGQAISQRLHTAAQMYEQSDQEGAAALRAAVAPME